MVKHLGLAGLGTRNKTLVKNVEDILANILKLSLDLLAIVTDGSDPLLFALGLLFLLDGRDNAPRSTAGPNNVLVGNGEKIALVDSELTTNLL